MSKDVKKLKVVDNEYNVEKMIDELVIKAKKAKEAMLELDQETIDNIVKEMAMAGLDKHIELAKMAVDETKRGQRQEHQGYILTVLHQLMYDDQRQFVVHIADKLADIHSALSVLSFTYLVTVV